MTIRNSLLVCLCIAGSATAQRPGATGPNFERIDAHVHVFQANPLYAAMLDRLNFRVLNITVVDKHERGFEEAEPQRQGALAVNKLTHGRAAWCATFDPQNWEQPGFARAAITQLERSFQDGAVAVKVYKDIGMELKSKSGEYLMPDNPVFSPILEAIEKHRRTLFAHIAEPSAAWRPLDPASPHYSYYKENPDWHMYRHPERPSKEAILAARDAMVDAHPNLRVVGCHLGSMEDDVDQIAKRFDRYPNFAVDTAARVPDLMLQPREKVRSFLIKYQDRVLYATDFVLMPGQDVQSRLRHNEDEYARDWKYFATDEMVTYDKRQVQGLALPDAVLRKIFRDNAILWVRDLIPPR
jgi:predicted TIM-barrel fold metal-dependent hydrolase